MLNLKSETVECNKTKVYNKPIDIINDGAILLSGYHIVNDLQLNGTYLITFTNQTVIDGVKYFNTEAIVNSYVRSVDVNALKIKNYIENQIDLNFENIDILNSENNYDKNSYISYIFYITIPFIIIFSFIVIYMKRYFKQREIQNDIFFAEINNRIQDLTNEYEISGRHF